MESLPSPPASLSSGKNPWMVKKHQPSISPTLSASKLERFITFLLAAWTTLASASSPKALSISNNNPPVPSPPSSSSSNHPTNAVVTRSLLPNVARQCLDLVMFTSAMIITLFSYFSGDLDNRQPHHHHHPSTASSFIKTPTRPNSSSIAVIPPPSKHTIMDIRELRKWQQQSHQGPFTPLLLDRQLEYGPTTFPMDDQKHQRIMAWASSQGQTSLSSGSTQVRALGGGDQLTTSSLQLNQHQHQHYSHSITEEIDDDEKYTFDERWSVDGGEPIQSNQLHPNQYHNISSKIQHQQIHSTAASTSSGKESAPTQEEDRRLAFMEVQVASLIQQGQAALTKKIQVHERHPNEIALRRAMKQRVQQKQ